MGYSRFMSTNGTIRQHRAENLIREAINRDSQSYSAANEWVSNGVEMNSALFPWEQLAHESMLSLLYNKLDKLWNKTKKTNKFPYKRADLTFKLFCEEYTDVF